MDQLERRIRLLLRAYPPQWREERGDELVGTALDLSRDRQTWPSARLAIDVLMGGWAERAHSHRRVLGGWFAAGWRLATVAAVVVQVAVGLAWIWQWWTDGFVPMLPVLGNASAATYLFSLIGFAVATILWLAGQATPARLVSAGSMLSWTVTVFVFQMLLAGGPPNHLVLVAWTHLAVLATWALWQPPPTYRVMVGLLTVVASAVTLAWVVAGPDTGRGFVRLAESGLLGRPGAATLPTLFLAGWSASSVLALLAVRRDPRPIVAVAAFLPFVVFTHPVTLAAPINVGVVILALVVLATAVSAARVVGRPMH